MIDIEETENLQIIFEDVDDSGMIEKYKKFKIVLFKANLELFQIVNLIEKMKNLMKWT